MNFKMENNLFSNSGVMGRSMFFKNMMFLFTVIALFMMPCIIWFAQNLGSDFSIMHLNYAYYHAPLTIQILFMFSICTGVVIGISNIRRRLTDIFGKEIGLVKNIVCTLYVIFLYSCFLPTNIAMVLNTLFLTILLASFLIKGKVTPILKAKALQTQE